MDDCEAAIPDCGRICSPPRGRGGSGAETEPINALRRGQLSANSPGRQSLVVDDFYGIAAHSRYQALAINDGMEFATAAFQRQNAGHAPKR